MKYARFALLAFAIALFAKIEPVRADYYWCDMLCGPEASCDTQCVDGGTNITCGTYNGGAGSGMCYDPPQCTPNWTGPFFIQYLGQQEDWWWHTLPDNSAHIDCTMWINESVYSYDQNECTSNPYSYYCRVFNDMIYHDVWPGYCAGIYAGGEWGTLDCPF